jgi:hypothetical protein
VRWVEQRDGDEQERPMLMAVWQMDGDGWSLVQDEPEANDADSEAADRAA